MAAISRRGQGGRIYNNTRACVLLRRMCVKPAALTTHSPLKISARSRTATRPRRALPPPTQRRRTPTQSRTAPAGCAKPSPPTSQPIPRRSSPLAPSIFSRPSRALLITHAAPTHAPAQRRTPAGCAMHSQPTAQPIPRRRPSLAPAQRHALPEHFCSPTQHRHTPASCAMHSSPPSQPIPRRRPSPAPAQRHALPEHFCSSTQPVGRAQAVLCSPADLTTHSPPKLFAHPTQRHTLPEHFRSPTQRRRTPAGCAMHSPPTSQPTPRRRPPLAPAAPTHARRLRDAFPADRTTHSPQRHAASPSVPLRAQKNGTAQCMCDAESLGRPSLRSVIWVGEPRAVRRRCGALAWRVGLRPQPWALRSRRCGRVLRA